MLKSMTGYGKAECLLPNQKLTIEIKSLNSKQIDTSTRLPTIYRSKELEIRKMLASKLERGKVECSFHYEIVEGSTAKINTAIVKNYFAQVAEIAEELKIPQGDIFSTIMRLPDTVISEKNELGESEWKLIRNSIDSALTELDNFRIREGEAMEKDLRSQISIITEKLSAVDPYEEERILKIKERLLNNLEELKISDFDKNRFEQELIYYMEKLDINEEKVRLSNHLIYFNEILDSDKSNGKKLGFVGQEIGREINTLGSKANHPEIQRLVVEMKEVLEKIKEQVLNVL